MPFSAITCSEFLSPAAFALLFFVYYPYFFVDYGYESYDSNLDGNWKTGGGRTNCFGYVLQITRISKPGVKAFTDIVRERNSLLNVVKALGEYLTSDDDQILGKGS